MSKIRFSNDQERAITAKGANYLISAGAGSGKTAVLTERIYRIAKEDKTLDKFLVLTFTNAAASEMKDRVRSKLLDDEETKFLASEVDNSHIETFDAFSLFLAKKYFYYLNISKDLSIVDNSVLSIKRKLFLDEVFEDKYEKEDKDFLLLIETYATKNENALKDFIIKLLQAGDKKGDNYAYFDYLKNNFFQEKNVDQFIKDYFLEIRDNLNFIREKAYELEDVDDSTSIIDFVDHLLSINDYDELYQALSENFPRKSSKNKTDDGEYRSAIADLYKKIKVSKDSDFGSLEQLKEKYLSTKEVAITLVNLAIETEKRLDAFKKEHNAYSFGDISRFVLRLLKDENIRKEISSSFDYIMVDEYQDTNDIQDTVISSIARDNVYMVGDVKQSIYRFRGADCHIFQEKYVNYKKHIGGEEIDLNTSYRSRKEVVDFVNELFSQLMTKNTNAIDYSNGHEFIFGREEYEINKPNCNYKPEVYSFIYENSSEVVDKECDILINDITHKIAEKYQVYNQESKSTRNCSFKDFAIIIDRGSAFEKIRRRFSEAGIPIKVESKETLFKSDVILVVKNLVRMLYYSLQNDYEHQYRHAYMSIARSFLYEYRDDYLYEIFKNKTYLLEEFAQKMELIKEKLRFAPIKKVLLTLYEEYDIYSQISKITQYYGNVHKLEHLLTLADSLDLLNYTLEDFIKYFDDLSELDEDIDYSDSDAQEDSVTLINIHKSKGLEYPIVYYPGLNKQFNRQDLNTSMLFSDRYGISLPSNVNEKHSILVHLIKEEMIKEDFEEKIRLLYVAITRAKEKIILIRGEKEHKEKLNKPTQSICFNDVLNLSNVIDKYNSDYPINKAELNSKEEEKAIEKISLKEINIPYKEIEHTRASKERGEDVDSGVLSFGSELHYYLEHLDFESDDLSYIKNRQMRKYVYNVKNSPLFKGVKNKDVRHEYHFYDNSSGIEGYIDALIIKENEVDIIDFKLKNIDEIEYVRQLNIYKDYIKKVTDKPIKMYLLAAITGEIKEVK